MFTVEQITEAHSKVRKGADFPTYIRELKSIGITHSETRVTDGHTDFQGQDNFNLSFPPKYTTRHKGEHAETAAFQVGTRNHQLGETDYATFIIYCAEIGVSHWAVHLIALTCTYFVWTGNQILNEPIPQ